MKFDTKNAQLSTIVPTGAAICVATGMLIRRWWRLRNMPPTFTMGLPVLGPIIEFLKSPLDLFDKGHKKMGECFRVNFIAQEWIFLIGRDGQEFSFTIPIFGPKVLYDTDYSTRMCQLRFIRERLTDNCLGSYVQTLQKEVLQFFDEEWPGNEGVVD